MLIDLFFLPVVVFFLNDQDLVEYSTNCKSLCSCNAVVFQFPDFVYISEVVGSQVQAVEQSAALQTLHRLQVVAGTVQVEERAHILQSSGVDQVVVVQQEPLQPPQGLQTS